MTLEEERNAVVHHHEEVKKQASERCIEDAKQQSRDLKS